MTVFDDKGILILDVKSYQANVILNKHTSHCIVSSESQWNNYVESPNTKQRLSVLTKSRNGFEIADEDLKLRGPEHQLQIQMVLLEA